MVKEKTKKAESPDETSDVLKDLILHNDDVHTFDFVIDALIKICKHTLEQAEQCSIIVHYKGKCAVKSGSLILLKTYGNRLAKLGLTVTIE